MDPVTERERWREVKIPDEILQRIQDIKPQDPRRLPFTRAVIDIYDREPYKATGRDIFNLVKEVCRIMILR